MEVPGKPGSAPSPQSEAVTNELQELSLQPAPNLLLIQERKNVLQLKLQQRRTREELVSQGIMPPLKSPAAFHEQRRSLERARTEDYLKRKIRSRPERSELVRMHILEETSAEPSLQAKQLKLKRARLADDLNDKISHRPGPIELVHKNILSVSCPLQSSLLALMTNSPKGAGGESSSLDEDSSDALSPDQLANHDSPLSSSQPNEANHGRDSAPLTTATSSVSHTAPSSTSSASSTSGFLSHRAALICDSPILLLQTSQQHRPPQRSKKPKDNKPKVKKLKYHQYIPPDQKADKERPPQMDSSYAKLLQASSQSVSLKAEVRAKNDPSMLRVGPSPSRTTLTTTTTAPSAQTTAARQSQAAAAGTKPTTLPANLDEFKVAELKQELKLRGLTVSGTKNDLIERLRNYQEQSGNTTASASAAATNTTTSASNTTPTFDHQPADGACFKLALSSLAQAVPGRVMRFGSTSSSPPVSPTPSERSLAGLSPDETSCNGDMFGEMANVTSAEPLGDLSPHPAHAPPLSSAPIKHGVTPTILLRHQDKDQMLQEKDKQIEELTRMLRQKQRLVETLRSQLEQGKMAAGAVVVKKEPPALQNGAALVVKEEAEPEKVRGEGQPTQAAAAAEERGPAAPAQQNQVKQTQVDVPAQQKNPVQKSQVQLKQVQVQIQNQKAAVSQRKQQRLQQRLQHKQQTAAMSAQQDTINSITRKRLSSHLSVTSQRLQSSPSKLPSTDSQSKQQPVAEPVGQPDKKFFPKLLKWHSFNYAWYKFSAPPQGQKAALHLDTNGSPQPSLSHTAPPSLQPFFDDMPDTESQSNLMSSLKVTLPRLGPPPSLCSRDPVSMQALSLGGSLLSVENGVNSQQMDDLFDILLKSGGFKKWEISPIEKQLKQRRKYCSNIRRRRESTEETCAKEGKLSAEPERTLMVIIFLSVFLQKSQASRPTRTLPSSTTGAPLLGMEPDGGGLTLIDDLHSQMLSTPSILDHPPSPMDTSDLSFSHHSAGLDFGDPTLDSMDWLDISMGNGGGGGASLTPLAPHTPPSVFSADFLDSTDLQLHWE
uniref:Myocardin related transcription factor Ab n=1 Tax=Poecilia formosa TaxID=48698 RepID=A0A096ME52_POEFO